MSTIDEYSPGTDYFLMGNEAISLGALAASEPFPSAWKRWKRKSGKVFLVPERPSTWRPSGLDTRGLQRIEERGLTIVERKAMRFQQGAGKCKL